MSWLSRLFGKKKNITINAGAYEEECCTKEEGLLLDMPEGGIRVEFKDQLGGEKILAEYIILTQGWTVKTMGENGELSKIISVDKTLITKQGVPTEELNKWIVDNYEPNGTLKTKE